MTCSIIDRERLHSRRLALSWQQLDRPAYSVQLNHKSGGASTNDFFL
jgi:hypothetical protein